nr:AT4G36440-like protein [Ipomoea batatas]
MFNFSTYVSIHEFWTRTIVELAIPCDKPGKRVFEGFTVGFHLRKWEISCFYVPPSLRSGVALARTTQSEEANEIEND